MTKFNILIVDDDPDDHFFITSAINEYSERINVISVYDGSQGLKYLGISETTNFAKKFPDLVICDINMPFVNGINFLERVKADENFKNIPIFILSTSCDDFTRKRLIELGAIDCIIKPAHTSNYNIILAKIFNEAPSFDDL